MTRRINLFFLFAAIALGGSAHAQYIALELQSNGEDIVGEPSRETAGGEDLAGAIEVLSFQFDVEQPVSDGRLTGAIVAKPFRFVKRVNRATPLILRGLVQGQIADGTFRFFGNAPDGAEVEAFQITFSNARISRQTPWSPFGQDGGLWEAIEILPETVVFTSVSGNTEFEFSLLGGLAR